MWNSLKHIAIPALAFFTTLFLLARLAGTG